MLNIAIPLYLGFELYDFMTAKPKPPDQPDVSKMGPFWGASVCGDISAYADSIKKAASSLRESVPDASEIVAFLGLVLVTSLFLYFTFLLVRLLVDLFFKILWNVVQIFGGLQIEALLKLQREILREIGDLMKNIFVGALAALVVVPIGIFLFTHGEAILAKSGRNFKDILLFLVEIVSQSLVESLEFVYTLKFT
jgi:hypothetical protein